MMLFDRMSLGRQKKKEAIKNQKNFLSNIGLKRGTLSLASLRIGY